ncbi:hypothetical protein [Sporichthya sp.]|uniref:hypothetical protein n=1 Tax=Sporichthya sp. TaxID=65475 RepID=UPI00180FC81E|nr:hypothetical protein [Sporichthya sp.]MBA3741361.1 hypothetical protein [Sporichthya sp.]
MADSYAAAASANAIDGTFTNQSLPLAFVGQGVGPEADATLDSLGTASANAYFPYIGPIAPGLPGIFLGALFGLPAPEYPFGASATAGSKPANVSYPGITLHAESGAGSVVGSATVGNDGVSGATSVARVDQTVDGGLSATADVAFNALKFGSNFSLTGFQSHAETVVSAAGKRVTSSSLSIARMTIPGLRITIPPATPGNVPIPVPVPGFGQLPVFQPPPVPFPFGGQTIDAPDIGFVDGTFTITLPFAGGKQAYAVPADAVLDAFRAGGANLSYQPAVQTKTGITGASFNVDYTVPALPPNPYFTGAVPTSFTLGGVTTGVSLDPSTAVDGMPADLPTGGAAAGGLPSSAGTDNVLGAGVDSAGVLPSGVGEVPGVAGSAAAAQTDQSGLPTATLRLAADARDARPIDGLDVYLLLIAVAAVGVFSATIVRLTGVKQL